MKTLLFLSITLFAFVSNAQTKYQLNVPVGFVIHSKVEMHNDMQMPAEDNKPAENINSIVTSYFRLIVSKVNKNEIVFNMIGDSVIMEMKEGEKKEYYHSAKPATFNKNEKMKETFSMIGKPFPFTVTKEGKLIKDDKNPPVAEYCFLEYCKKAINLKDQWTIIDDSPTAGKTENTYKLESVNDKEMNLSVESKNILLGTEAVKSAYKTDPITGLIISYDNTVEMEMMFKMKVRVIYSTKW
jgi:hypothetical protein